VAHRSDGRRPTRAGSGAFTSLQSRSSRRLPRGRLPDHPLGMSARPHGAPTEKVPSNLTEAILARGSESRGPPVFSISCRRDGIERSPT
jgi:hypothetical protein